MLKRKVSGAKIKLEQLWKKSKRIKSPVSKTFLEFIYLLSQRLSNNGTEEKVRIFHSFLFQIQFISKFFVDLEKKINLIDDVCFQCLLKNEVATLR